MVSKPAALTELINCWVTFGFPQAVSPPIASNELPRFQPTPINLVRPTLLRAAPLDDDELDEDDELEDDEFEDDEELDEDELGLEDELELDELDEELLELLPSPPQAVRHRAQINSAKHVICFIE